MTTGLQSSGQIVINTSMTLGTAQAGANILVTNSGITLTLPSTAESFAISNISAGPITLVYPLGSDFGSTLYPRQQVLLAGDGGGFWRVVLQSMDAINAVGTVTGRSAMAALPAAAGNTVFLTENGREGLFEFKAGNYSSQIAGDTLQGLYVASSSASPSSGCWVRQRSNGPVKPEWFGAQLNDGAFNNAPAINAALAVGGWVELGKGIYYCSNGIVMPDYSVLEGPGPIHCSIEISHATDHLISCTGVANTSYLGSPRGSNFAVYRSVNPTTPANPANDKSQGHGIHCYMVSNPIFENVYTYNNLVELYINNVLSGRFEHIRGIRSLGGSSDRWSGIWVDGLTSGGTFGGPSPNPSLTVAHTNMGCGFNPSNGYGVFGNGSLADLWLIHPETAGGNKGIYFDLSSGGGSAGSDVKVTNPVCDGYKTNGIHIKSAPFGSNINIESPYVAGASGATDAAIRLELSHGVAVTNVQAIGTLAPGVYGLSFSDGSECTVTGRFVDYDTAAYAISAGSCDFDIKAVSNSGSSTTQAFLLVGGSRNRVSLATRRLSGAWTYGIAMDASAAECFLDVSRVQGATNRIARATSPITTQGNVNSHMIVNPGLAITV